MTIRLTPEQWADVQQGTDAPVRVSDPGERTTFVLMRAELYEPFQALFEEVPVTREERLFQLRQFGQRAGWNDPQMDVYDDLNPRRRP